MTVHDSSRHMEQRRLGGSLALPTMRVFRTFVPLNLIRNSSVEFRVFNIAPLHIRSSCATPRPAAQHSTPLLAKSTIFLLSGAAQNRAFPRNTTFPAPA